MILRFLELDNSATLEECEKINYRHILIEDIYNRFNGEEVKEFYEKKAEESKESTAEELLQADFISNLKSKIEAETGSEKGLVLIPKDFCSYKVIAVVNIQKRKGDIARYILFTGCDILNDEGKVIDSIM